MTDVIYIKDAAPMLGKSETALRALLQRATRNPAYQNVPPFFRVGGRFAFSRTALKSWIKAQCQKGTK